MSLSKSLSKTKPLLFSLFKKIINIRLHLAVIIIRFIFVILILLVILRSPNTNPNVEIINKDLTPLINYSVEVPEEELPSDNYKWQGSELDPKSINISSINLNGYILNVGIDQNNEVAVPPNVHLAGWFVESVRPGEKGLSIIDGHVDGLNVGGIFKNLNSLKNGDEIKIVMGNDKVYTYRVKDIKTVFLNEAAGVLFSQDPTITSQLNLITCIGTYLNDQRTYDHRLVVISELIN